jgi:ankyrin repeat protein
MSASATYCLIKELRLKRKGSKRGSKALMTTALEGHVAAIEVLLNRGAQTEAKTNLGDTGLIYAADRE